ncbi:MULTISPECIES: entericidin [Sinorhizobium]|nr:MULTISPECIES: entericidin [Sinorhizobium]PDT84481.1 entericidin [Sinorhizobium sp. BJ1]
MSRTAIAMLCFALLTLSSCANTARGFRQDSTQTGHAVDSATKRVLGAAQ